MRAAWPGVAASYVGAVVGAGFASGREIFHFFAAYGRSGVVGASLAGFLFSLFGAIALHRISTARHRHYGDLLRDVCGHWLGGALDFLGVPFLFISLAAVQAGAGALGGLLLDWPRWSGASLLALLLALGVLGGRAFYLRLNLLALPLVAAACIAVGLYARTAPVAAVAPAARIPWAVAAILYVSYNLLLALAGLCVAAGATTTPREAAAGGLVGGGALWGLCTCVTVALVPRAADARLSELPLAAAIPHVAWGAVAYPFLFLLSLWTTGEAAALALGQRLRPAAPALPGAALALAALPLALAGLPSIVARAYPVIGYTGLILLIALCARPFRGLRPWQRRQRRTG